VRLLSQLQGTSPGHHAPVEEEEERLGRSDCPASVEDLLVCGAMSCDPGVLQAAARKSLPDPDEVQEEPEQSCAELVVPRGSVPAYSFNRI
jgi:hypothetical protein